MLNGTLGFAMIIALLFCMPSDIPDTLDAVTFYPFMSIYTYAVGSTAGATAMVSSLTEILHRKASSAMQLDMTDSCRLASSLLLSSSLV